MKSEREVREFLKLRASMWECMEKQLRKMGLSEKAVEFRRGLWTGLTYGWLMVRRIQLGCDPLKEVKE